MNQEIPLATETPLLTTVSQINPIVFRVAATEADAGRQEERASRSAARGAGTPDVAVVDDNNHVSFRNVTVHEVDQCQRRHADAEVSFDVESILDMYNVWHIVRSDDKRRARLNVIAFLLSLIPHHKIKRGNVTPPGRSQKHAYDDEATLAGRRFVPEQY